MMPRMPSISCRSVTRSRSFSIDSRSSSVLPSTTTSTSNSLDGKRCVTSSYCRNSGVSERNSWLSESSTLMRSTPKAAGDAKRDQDDGGHDRSAQRDQADPLNAIGKVVQLARRGSIGSPQLARNFLWTQGFLPACPALRRYDAITVGSRLDQIRGMVGGARVVHWLAAAGTLGGTLAVVACPSNITGSVVEFQRKT